MMTARDALLDHLGGGITTVCRAWKVTRPDGVSFGFTDHDVSFQFEGVTFKASTGMTALALQQTSGMSVDNSEAAGALSDAAVEEADIVAGRFDGAEVRIWLVNWNDPNQRMEQFRGNFGEISRAGGAYKAELRGLTDRLNQLQGRVYQRGCPATLGDKQCGIDVRTETYSCEATLSGFDGRGMMLFDGLLTYPGGWFERGVLQVITGAAAGLTGTIKIDRPLDVMRVVDLWTRFSVELSPGDRVRLVAGCDKLASTCRKKFSNFLNFRGFPHIPGEDWLTSYPVPTRTNDGGSLGR